MKTQQNFSSKQLDFFIRKFIKSLQFDESKSFDDDKFVKIIFLNLIEGKTNQKTLIKQQKQKKKKNIDYINQLLYQIGMRKQCKLLNIDCNMDKVVSLLGQNKQNSQIKQNNKQSEDLVDKICLLSVNHSELNGKLNTLSKNQIKQYVQEQFPLILLYDKNGNNFFHKNKLKLTHKARNKKQLNQIFFNKNNLEKSLQKIIQKQSGKLNLNYYDSLMWRHNVKLQRKLKRQEQKMKNWQKYNKQKQIRQQQKLATFQQNSQKSNKNPTLPSQQIPQIPPPFTKQLLQTQLQKIQQQFHDDNILNNHNNQQILQQKSSNDINNINNDKNNFINICTFFSLILLLMIVLIVKLKGVLKKDYRKKQGNGSDTKIKVDEGTSLFAEN